MVSRPEQLDAALAPTDGVRAYELAPDVNEATDTVIDNEHADSESVDSPLHGLHAKIYVADTPVFDKVVVITDRNVLDKQLQDTIYQFDHAHGVVQKIDKDSMQLADALAQPLRCGRRRKPDPPPQVGKRSTRIPLQLIEQLSSVIIQNFH